MSEEDTKERTSEEVTQSPDLDGGKNEELAVVGSRVSETSGRILQIIEKDEAYTRAHFVDEIVPASERAGTVPESAWLQLRSPAAVEEILGPHTPEWRAGYFSYGDKTPGTYGELDEEAPELPKAPNFFARRIHALLDHTEIHEQDLKDSFSRWLQQQHNIEIPDEEMVFCKSICGGITAILEAHEASTEKHMAVITPFYDNMMTYLQNATGDTFSQFGLVDSDESWKFDAGAFEQGLDAAEPKITSLLLCHPNNPTGYVFSEADLRSIVEACKKRGVFIISDEAWADFVHHPEKKHTPLLKVARELGYAERVVMQYGPAKTFNTSGFPCAMMAVPNKKLRNLLTKTLSRPSQLAAEAVIAGFQNGSEHMQQLNRFLRENLTFIAETLRKKGYRVHIPDATYVIYPFIGDDHDAVTAEIREAGIFTRNKGKEAGAEGYLRLTAGVPKDILEKCYREWLESIE